MESQRSQLQLAEAEAGASSSASLATGTSRGSRTGHHNSDLRILQLTAQLQAMNLKLTTITKARNAARQRALYWEGEALIARDNAHQLEIRLQASDPKQGGRFMTVAGLIG